MLHNLRKYFPEITDWTSDNNQLRYKNPKHMSIAEIIIFNPFMFKWITIGTPIFYGFICILIFAINNNNPIIQIISCLLSIYFTYDGEKKARLYYKSNTNFYDIYLRG